MVVMWLFFVFLKGIPICLLMAASPQVSILFIPFLDCRNLKKDIAEPGKVQRRAAKMMRGLGCFPSEERLESRPVAMGVQGGWHPP